MRLRSKLKDFAIHWPGSSNDGFGGYSYGDPAEYNVRWQDKQETFIDFDGEEQVSNAIVYLDVSIARKGSWMKQGQLTDLSSSDDDPKEIKDTFPVRGIQQSPTLRNKQVWYKVYL